MISIKHLKGRSFFLAVATLLITLLSVSYWYVRIRPIDLTDKYGTEVAESLEYMEQTIANYEAPQGVETLTDVATGDYLEALLEDRIDCSNCRFRVLVINVLVSNLKIVTYSEDRVKVQARIETANVSIERSTGQVRTPCYGLATEETIVLIKEDGKWKISGGEASKIDTWTPVEALRESACPANWEEELNNFLIATPSHSIPLPTVPVVSKPIEIVTFDHYFPTPIPPGFWTTNLVTVQKSLLGDPCLAPCWYNIEPHKTTITTTLAILNQLQEQDVIQDFYPKNSPTSTGYIVIFAHNFDGAIEGNEGIVETISFGMSARYLTLGELLLAYGEPDYVKGAQGESYEGLSLAYPRYQLIAYARTEQLGGEQLVTPDLMITSLTYLLPTRFSEIIEDSILGWVKWDGQQSFSYYYQKAGKESQ